MSQPRILVTSAAGNTGIPATLQLLEHGFPVRAFVRRYDDRAKRLEDAGAEIFVGDQYSIADMRKAISGVQRAYHCSPTAPFVRDSKPCLEKHDPAVIDRRGSVLSLSPRARENAESQE